MTFEGFIPRSEMSDVKWNQFLQAAAAAPYIAVDTETNGHDIRDGRGYAIGLSISVSLNGLNSVSTYIPYRHRQDNYSLTRINAVRDLLTNHTCLIFHNAKFDLVSLKTMGIDYKGKFYDTMLMAHWCDENIPSKALDYLGKKYFNVGKRDVSYIAEVAEFIGWGNMPADNLEEYAAFDTYLTLKLFNLLMLDFDAQGLDGELWDKEQEWIRLISRMEGRGVLIDQDLSASELEFGRKRMLQLTRDLRINPGSPTELKKLLIDDLGLPVVKETKGGKVSFDKEAMAQYDLLLQAIDDDRAKKVLEYRGWQKTTSSNYAPYLDLLSPDGRLRPNYKLHGTRTGRLSCEKPNLQQIPRVSSNRWNGSLKRAFIAKPGYTLWEVDYAQLELRLGASYGNVGSLLKAFEDGRDVFTEMAEALNMKRQDVKTLTYTIQYGGGVNRISTVFGVSPFEAQSLRQNFYDAYPGFKKVQTVASARAASQGYIKYWTGRRRHFDRPEEQAFKAFNSAIQGGAAEIVKRQLIEVDKQLDSPDCRLLLQVHDSGVWEIKNGKESELLPEISRIMTDVPQFGVTFAVDAHKWGGE